MQKYTYFEGEDTGTQFSVDITKTHVFGRFSEFWVINVPDPFTRFAAKRIDKKGRQKKSQMGYTGRT